MHIFARRHIIVPSQAEAAEQWAIEASQRAEETTGFTSRVARGLLGHRVGTLIWTARLDTIADVDTYVSVLDQHERNCPETATFFATPAEQCLEEVIAATNVHDPARYNSVTSLQCERGTTDEAVQWGTEVSRHVGELTGCASLFTQLPYGRHGEMRWRLGVDEPSQLDETNELLRNDTDYLDYVNRATNLFVTSATRHSVSKQL